MLTTFKRLSLNVQAASILALLAAGVASATYLAAANSAQALELAQSRTVADMVEALRAQAARNGGFYVRRDSSQDPAAVGRFLATYDVVAPAPDGSPRTYTFHHKNPFIALGDFAAVVQKKAATTRFRMVSDNFMNPANVPDAFELEALQYLRVLGGFERWAVVGDQMRYARPIRADKACLTCHGEASHAPASVRALYEPPPRGQAGGGYGYVEGQIVGLTSVTVQHRGPAALLQVQSGGFWAVAGVVALLLIASFLAIARGLVGPLRRQTRYIRELAVGTNLRDVEPTTLDREEISSRNELHQASHGLKAIHESLSAAIDAASLARHRDRG